MYCVIDTERIKGNQIYLFSYQLYNDDFKLIESKAFQDISIDVSNRESNICKNVTVKRMEKAGAEFVLLD